MWRRSGVWSYWLFWLLVCLLLAGGVYRASAQPANYAPSLSSSESSLQSLIANWTRLELQLQKRKISYDEAEKRVSELLQELSEVRRSLQDSLEYSARSEAEISRLTALLQLSEQTLSDLRTTSEELQRASRAAVRRAWLLGGLAGAGAAGLLWLLLTLLL